MSTYVRQDPDQELHHTGIDKNDGSDSALPNRQTKHTSQPPRPPEVQRSPHTPPQHRRQHEDSPVSSPALPSPMSLFQLGIGSPLSPLRRQLSSPLARSPPTPKRSPDRIIQEEAAEHDDGGGDTVDMGLDSDDERMPDPPEDDTEDSKDVLVERLTDLVSRLSGGARLGSQDINNLHSQVDQMERVLSTNRRASKRHSRISSSGSFRADARDGGGGGSQQDPFWAGPSTPTWLMAHFSDLSQHSPAPDTAEPALAEEELGVPEFPAADPAVANVSSEVAADLVVEAEKLCAELSAVVTSLQARREESDHIHGLLVERAELAAQRIIQLEAKLEETEDEIQENESELSHLRLQLRAIEASCLEYVPQDADPELLESIENWKKDWASLQKKMTERHLNHEGHSFTGDTTVTSMGTPRR